MLPSFITNPRTSVKLWHIFYKDVWFSFNINSLHNLFWWDVLKICRYLLCTASVYNVSPRLHIYLVSETSSTSRGTIICLLSIQINCTNWLGLASFYQEEFPDFELFFSGCFAIFKQSRHKHWGAYPSYFIYDYGIVSLPHLPDVLLLMHSRVVLVYDIQLPIRTLQGVATQVKTNTHPVLILTVVLGIGICRCSEETMCTNLGTGRIQRDPLLDNTS